MKKHLKARQNCYSHPEFHSDESARSLDIEGTQGDATLRSFMNWSDIADNFKTQDVLTHWQKLGRFRSNHPAIGGGKHNQITAKPYVFSRVFTQAEYTDKVVIGLDLPKGEKEIAVGTIFTDGTKVKDVYSGKTTVVANGKVNLNTEFGILLLEQQ